LMLFHVESVNCQVMSERDGKGVMFFVSYLFYMFYVFVKFH
jgi:hypothetical protein